MVAREGGAARRGVVGEQDEGVLCAHARREAERGVENVGLAEAGGQRPRRFVEEGQPVAFAIHLLKQTSVVEGEAEPVGHFVRRGQCKSCGRSQRAWFPAALRRTASAGRFARQVPGRFG